LGLHANPKPEIAIGEALIHHVMMGLNPTKELDAIVREFRV